MTTDSVQDRIDALLRSALQVEDLSLDLDLIDTGIMDSLALVALITDIEEDFQTELPLDDFDIELFRTPASIAEFVAANRTQEVGQ